LSTRTDGKIENNRISIFSSIVNDAYFNSLTIIPSIADLNTEQNFGLGFGNKLNNFEGGTEFRKEIFLNFYMPKSDIDFHLQAGNSVGIS